MKFWWNRKSEPSAEEGIIASPCKEHMSVDDWLQNDRKNLGAAKQKLSMKSASDSNLLSGLKSAPPLGADVHKTFIDRAGSSASSDVTGKWDEQLSESLVLHIGMAVGKLGADVQAAFKRSQSPPSTPDVVSGPEDVEEADMNPEFSPTQKPEVSEMDPGIVKNDANPLSNALDGMGKVGENVLHRVETVGEKVGFVGGKLLEIFDLKDIGSDIVELKDRVETHVEERKAAEKQAAEEREAGEKQAAEQ
mmetsp:Transcript_70592/g.147018  ORF Transcript_70592/g.147018 Transcript_70592/m.147018 type:complete len:249 (+) Transcript_70592:144-890(+)|eukprot:CAMPEP_0181326712 /NCGR_PEP_ID=MMETSP1101-20121128/21668_1 /TAXON_ID=46948 /ORGANISM="Rhodomonas abbreviata, Strain Caron Lab Isolate" /LENGTH=248 /DNA_ID=CAMNT_0023435231 /DNA_START=144 /DNA_END=890 /DNA_ORIENTATION=-